jgi:hypothetical protein
MQVAETKKLTALEDENRRLKKLVADLARRVGLASSRLSPAGTRELTKAQSDALGELWPEGDRLESAGRCGGDF